MRKWSRSKHLPWLFLWLLPFVVQCQEVNDYDQIDNPSVLPLVTQLVYSRLSNLTSLLSQEIATHSTFCVKDPLTRTAIYLHGSPVASRVGPAVFLHPRRLTLEIQRRFLQELQTANLVVKDSSALMASHA
ncbi:hypothetical protein PIB30_055126 [Stylosanthes scabra]|uniref:Uncharacterized protein n=1 Tax=Stylosanthes scabra TaxID=79078 RepID=A0ABU6YJ63_9FABA|nr:hypothetical protein [Stylosanthes scabra]